MILQRRYPQYERISSFYACAWLDHQAWMSICYPLGVHWIARWCRSAYINAFRIYKPTQWERDLQASYCAGSRKSADLISDLRDRLDDLKDKVRDEGRAIYARGWNESLEWLSENIGKKDSEIAESRDKAHRELKL